MATNTLKRRFARLEQSKLHLQERELKLVKEARDCGWTWDEIAVVLHMTRQGARMRYRNLPARLEEFEVNS
jgi:hypothetical protein